MEANSLNNVDFFGLSSFFFVRPTPVVIRPFTSTRSGMQQRPGESIAQFSRRIENTINERHRNGIPEIRQPVNPPSSPASSKVGNSVKLIDKIGDFLKDLKNLDDLFSIPPMSPEDQLMKDLQC